MNNRLWLFLALGVLAIAVLLGAVFCLTSSWSTPLPPAPPGAIEAAADYGYLHRETWTVTTSGADGIATGSGTSTGAIHGRIYGLYLDYSSGITTTTDVYWGR